MRLVVQECTYPGSALRPGDRVQWRLERGAYRLYREGDGPLAHAQFASPDVDRDGRRANGDSAVLVGLVGECKSKGWRLVLRAAEGEEWVPMT